MTGEEMVKRFEALASYKTNLIRKKNNDYAKEQDAFSNFRFCADFAGISIEHVFRVFIAVKVARLQELFNGKLPQNESVSDTLIDLANYADLLNMYISPSYNTVEPEPSEAERTVLRRAGVRK